jgi:hypothetical protein
LPSSLQGKRWALSGFFPKGVICITSRCGAVRLEWSRECGGADGVTII